MLQLIKTAAIAFHQDRKAANAIEYALLASFIAVAVIVGVTAVGTNLETFFASLGTEIGTFKG